MALSLPDVPANQGLLAFRRERAVRAAAGEPYAVDGWQAHTHPDLHEHLYKLAPSPNDFVNVYGVPAIIANGIAAIVALGTSSLLFRLPEPPVGVEMNVPIAPLDSQGWYNVSAWRVDIPRLRALTRTAMRYAAELA